MATLSGLLVWIVLVFVYPNITRYLVHHAVRIPAMDIQNRQIEEMQDTLEERVRAAFPEREIGPGWYDWFSSGEYGLPGLIGVTQKANFDWHRACVEAGIPVMLEGQDDIVRTLDEYKGKLIRQRRWAESCSVRQRSSWTHRSSRIC